LATSSEFALCEVKTHRVGAANNHVMSQEIEYETRKTPNQVADVSPACAYRFTGRTRGGRESATPPDSTPTAWPMDGSQGTAESD
jgi:hypothetical protein